MNMLHCMHLHFPLPVSCAWFFTFWLIFFDVSHFVMDMNDPEDYCICDDYTPCDDDTVACDYGCCYEHFYEGCIAYDPRDPDQETYCYGGNIYDCGDWGDLKCDFPANMTWQLGGWFWVIFGVAYLLYFTYV